MRCKDNASAAGAGQTDNFTVNFSADEYVCAEAGRICPPRAQWSSEPVNNSGTIEMTAAWAFGPDGDRDVEYLFGDEGVTWTVGYQDSAYTEVGTPTPLTLPRTFTLDIRTKTGLINAVAAEPYLLSS